MSSHVTFIGDVLARPIVGCALATCPSELPLAESTIGLFDTEFVELRGQRRTPTKTEFTQSHVTVWAGIRSQHGQ